MPWPIRTASREYPSVHYIHPYKQGKVEELIDYVQANYPSIKVIVVFGSTVDGRCKPWSDLDILIVGDTERKFVPPDNDKYDYFRLEELAPDSRLLAQILKEGYIVYDTRLVKEG